MDDQLVALDLDHRALEQLLRPARRDARIGAGADFDVIRPGDLDLLEIADLVVARDGRAAVFGVDLAAAGDGGGSGDRPPRRGTCACVLLLRCVISAIQQRANSRKRKKRAPGEGRPCQFVIARTETALGAGSLAF